MKTSLSLKKYYQEAVFVLGVLEEAGFEARLAGGCVRDRLLGIDPKDYDVATTARPTDVCAIFKQKGLRIIPTGLDHGTVTVVLKFSAVEVTTLRQDVNTDGRHAEVIFGDSFEKDAERRDFTVNAMYQDKSGQIYDYFDGQEHLSKRELHFVGEARLRIQEDYLRVMRLYRFWGKYDLEPSAEALEAVQEIGAGLRRVSQERITSELMTLLATDDPYFPLKHLFASQLMLMIMPDAKLPQRHSLLESARILGRNRAISRLVIMISEIANPEHLKAISKKLKLSNLDQDKILALLTLKGKLQSSHVDQAAQMELIDHCESIEKDFFLGVCVLVWKVLEENKLDAIDRLAKLEETKRHIRQAALPVSSKDVMLKFNMIPGPELGRALERLKQGYRNEVWTDRQAGLSWLAREMKELKS